MSGGAGQQQCVQLSVFSHHLMAAEKMAVCSPLDWVCCSTESTDK